MNSRYSCRWADMFGGGVQIFCQAGYALQDICKRTAEAVEAVNIYAAVNHFQRAMEVLKQEPINFGTDFVCQHPVTCVMSEKLYELAMLKANASRTEQDKKRVIDMAAGINVSFVVYPSLMSPAVGMTAADRMHWERILHAWWHPEVKTLADFAPTV